MNKEVSFESPNQERWAGGGCQPVCGRHDRGGGGRSTTVTESGRVPDESHGHQARVRQHPRLTLEGVCLASLPHTRGGWQDNAHNHCMFVICVRGLPSLEFLRHTAYVYTRVYDR